MEEEIYTYQSFLKSDLQNYKLFKPDFTHALKLEVGLC